MGYIFLDELAGLSIFFFDEILFGAREDAYKELGLGIFKLGRGVINFFSFVLRLVFPDFFYSTDVCFNDVFFFIGGFGGYFFA